MLVCIAVIIVVVAFAGAFGLIQNHIVDSNRQAVMQDLRNMAHSALEYYNAPLYIGGGNGNWIPVVDGEYQTQRCGLWLNHAGFNNHTSNDSFITENGTFEMWVNSYEDKNLKFEGTGLEIGNDGIYPVKVLMTVNGPTSGISFNILN